jgi:hypothetical protein
MLLRLGESVRGSIIVAVAYTETETVHASSPGELSGPHRSNATDTLPTSRCTPPLLAAGCETGSQIRNETVAQHGIQRLEEPLRWSRTREGVPTIIR